MSYPGHLGKVERLGNLQALPAWVTPLPRLPGSFWGSRHTVSFSCPVLCALAQRGCKLSVWFHNQRLL